MGCGGLIFCKRVLLVCLVFVIILCCLVSIHRDRNDSTQLHWISRDALSFGLSDTASQQNKNGRLFIFGEAAQFDRQSNTYYVPVRSNERDCLSGLSWSDGDEQAYLVMDGMEGDIASAVETGHAFTIACKSDGSAATSQLVFTGLPMLTIETLSDDTIPVTDDKTVSKFVLFDPNSGNGYQINTYYGYDRVRGSYSRNFSKISYDMALCGGPQSLLGLRKDDKWILMPMHMDLNKLRDKLALDLWNDFAQANPRVNYTGIHMAYIELMRDGRYWGLYGLVERVTGESLGLSPNDTLFKVSRASKHSSEAYEAVKNTLDGKDTDTDIRWPTVYREKLWEPMIQYVKSFIEEPDNYAAEDLYAQLDLENAADYTIYLLTVAAEDNNIHNTFYVFAGQEDGGTKLRRIPWDLTITFGYRNFLSEHDSGFDPNELTRINPPISMIHLMERDLEGFFRLLSNRYRELRGDFLTPEHILENLYIQSALITKSGAMGREIDRWTVVENTLDTSGLEQFIRDRFRVLDDYFLTPYEPGKVSRLG